MNTQTELSEKTLRALAIMQHNDEPFFIFTDEDGNETAFAGNEDQARADFRADIEGTEEAEIDANFLIYCQNNLEEVSELDAQDEQDGYIALTDEEAETLAGEYIRGSLWAFNPSFLSGETGIDEEVFQAIAANDRCESNNSAIERLIGDMDSFIESAISADGRGHFLNTYDGDEHEETVNDQTFYIYRMS